jgi:hypothetical protein
VRSSSWILMPCPPPPANTPLPAGNRARTTVAHRILPRRQIGCVVQWSRGDSNPGPPPCKGGALPAKLRPPARPGAPGGRAWTRTRDLGLIRTALSPPELRARRRDPAPKTECSPNPTPRSIPRIGSHGAPLARLAPTSPPSTPGRPSPAHHGSLDHSRSSLERR